MTEALRHLLWISAPAFLTCVSLAALVWPFTSPTPLAWAADAGNCLTNTTDFTIGYPNDGSSITLREDGFHLKGRSWLSTQVCTPSTLSVTASGQVAGGGAPRLEISLDGQKLASESFTSRRKVKVTIPHTGRITLAYLNDYYLSEYRMAVMERIRLQNAPCGNLPSVSPNNTAPWFPEESRAHLIYEEPLLLMLCGDGVLEMQVWGQEAAGEFPHLILEQGERVLSEIDLTPTKQRLRLHASAGPLSIRVTNSYTKQLADRNLYIHQIELLPKK